MMGAKTTALPIQPSYIGTTRRFFEAATRDSWLRVQLVVLDVVALWLAFGTARLLRSRLSFGGPELPGNDSILQTFWLIPTISFIVFSYLELYKIRRARRYSELLFQLGVGLVLVIALFLTVAYGLRVYYSRLIIAYFAGVALLYLWFGRVLWRHWLLLLRNNGLFLRRLAIVGESPACYDLVNNIKMHPELGYEITGLLTAGENHSEGTNGTNGGVRSAKETHEVLGLLKSEGVSELVFCSPPKARREFLDLIAQCQIADISVRILPEFYEVVSSGMEIEEVEGIPLIRLREPKLSDWEALVKRSADLVIASLALILLAPVAVLVGILLRFGQCRSVLKSEEKIGQLAKPIRLFRFSLSSCTRQSECRLGGFCRRMDRYSVGEIPELMNVLRGDISLVGPRPESLERVARYTEWNRRRLLIQPGLTGWAQVNGLRGFDSSDQKTSFDMAYLEKRSLMFDLLILLQTPFTLLKRPGETDLRGQRKR